MINYLEDINSYINRNMNETIHPEKSLEYLESLREFFQERNISFNEKLLTDLLNSNSILVSLMKVICESEDIRELETNSFFKTLKTVYLKLSQKKKESSDEREYLSDVRFPIDTVDLYIRDIKRMHLLTEEEEKELGRRIAEGDKEAWKELVSANLALVVSIAKRYLNRGLPFSDLIEEGNIGLMKAAIKFDYTKDIRFSTYATPSINNEIIRALHDKVRIIRRPTHRFREYFLYEEAYRRLSLKLGRTPEDLELVEELEMPLKKIMEIKEELATLDPVSLDSTVYDDEEETTIGDFFGFLDVGYEEAEKTKIDFEEIRKILRLTPHQQEFFDMFFIKGITKSEIAKIWNCSRQNVGITSDIVFKKIRARKNDILKAMGLLVEEKKTLSIKIPSFYNSYNEDKKIIDYIIVKELDDYERYIIYLLFGSDLENPHRQLGCNKEIAREYHFEIKPKIKERILRVKKRIATYGNQDFLTKDVDVKEALEKIKNYNESQVDSQESVAIEEQERVVEEKIAYKRLITSQKEVLRLSSIVFQELKNPEYIVLLEGLKTYQILVFVLMLGVDKRHVVMEIASWLDLDENEVLSINQEVISKVIDKEDILKRFINSVIKKYNNQEKPFILEKKHKN